MEATRDASAKRREQNKMAQRVFRDKKRREKEQQDLELSTAKQRLQEAEAERDRLRQQIRMDEPRNIESGSPLATPCAYGGELKQVLYDDSQMYATPSTIGCMPVVESLPEDVRSTWSRPGTEEAEMERTPGCQSLVLQPAVSSVSQGPEIGDQAGSHVLSNCLPNDILSRALSEWEKSGQYAIRSAEQYNKAAEQTAQKAQTLFQLYASMNPPLWGMGAAYRPGTDPSSQSYPATTTSWPGTAIVAPDQESNK